MWSPLEPHSDSIQDLYTRPSSQKEVRPPVAGKKISGVGLFLSSPCWPMGNLGIVGWRMADGLTDSCAYSKPANGLDLPTRKVQPCRSGLRPDSPQEDGWDCWFTGKVARGRILGAGVGQAPEHPTNGGCLRSATSSLVKAAEARVTLTARSPVSSAPKP